MSRLLLFALLGTLSLAASASPHRLPAPTAPVHQANDTTTAILTPESIESSPRPSFLLGDENGSFVINPASQPVRYQDEVSATPVLPAPPAADNLSDTVLTGNLQPITACGAATTEECPAAASPDEALPSGQIPPDAPEPPALMALGIAFLGAASTVIGRRPLG